MSVECGSCGRRLPEEFGEMPRRPCPECGATARILSASAYSNVNASMSAVAGLRYGHTGREVLGAEAEQRAIEWASLPSREAILNHLVAEDFRGLIASASCLSGDGLVLYRGQGIRDGDQRPPTFERMGPPPPHLARGEGRYHRKGERVLYLADSVDGVRREMEAWHTAGVPYVIRILVPLTTSRIADFSNWPPDNLITAVFARAEMCNVPQRGPENYIFSQTVGELVSERFDGMQIPGVRGAPGAHYKNIVLFRGLEDWRNWVSPANPAYRMFPPSHEHISVAAYYLWEKDGRVHGRDQAHWFQANNELP